MSTPLSPIITISGPSGSGKSTVAKLVAEHFGIRNVDTGAIFRAMAAENGMTVEEYGAYASKHPEVDHEVERRMLNLAKRAKKGIVLQGRLNGWTTYQNGVPAVRFWVTAPAQTRASRIASREKANYSEILKIMTERDEVNRRRYKQTYGLDLNDKSIYDSVVQTSNLSPDDVADIIIRRVSNVWRTKSPQPKKRRRTAQLQPKAQPRSRKPRKK